MNPSLYHQARHRTLREAFVNEDGAIDLASIMVGIIVIGLIGGVIAATIFAVIPWAQDNAAKQQLDSVANAENAYRGLAEDAGVPSGKSAYGTVSELKAPVFNGKAQDSLLSDVRNLDIQTTPAPNSGYRATITSDSGKVFVMTNGGNPTEAPAQSGGDSGAGDSTGTNSPAYVGYQINDEDADPYNYHATSVDDGHAWFHLEPNGNDDGATTDALRALIDSNAPVVPSTNDATYPTDSSQWVITRYNGAVVSNYFRPSKVTFSDESGVIASYVPGTGNEMSITAGQNGYGYGGLIPSSVTDAQKAKIGDASSNFVLTVQLVIEGKTFTFHQE